MSAAFFLWLLPGASFFLERMLLGTFIYFLVALGCVYFLIAPAPGCFVFFLVTLECDCIFLVDVSRLYFCSFPSSLFFFIKESLFPCLFQLLGSS